MSKIFLSVVIPSYDEMANLQKGVLDKVEHFLSKKGYSYEVIVVDDGSKDGSVELMRQFVRENPNFRLIENSHLGKGGAVTSGILNSNLKPTLQKMYRECNSIFTFWDANASKSKIG